MKGAICSRLHVRVPWTSLKSKPVTIEIEVGKRLGLFSAGSGDIFNSLSFLFSKKMLRAEFDEPEELHKCQTNLMAVFGKKKKVCVWGVLRVGGSISRVIFIFSISQKFSKSKN